MASGRSLGDPDLRLLAINLAALLFGAYPVSSNGAPTLGVVDRRAAMAAELSERLQDGDLIFRQGTDAVSRAVLAQSSAARFSHVGMLVHGSEGIAVVHAIPGEDGASGGVVSESLGEFTSPGAAKTFAIYRLVDLSESRRVEVRDYLMASLGKPFDLSLRFSDDEEMYCTELVLKAIAAAGVSLVDSLQPWRMVGLQEAAYVPDALLEVSGLVAIASEP